MSVAKDAGNSVSEHVSGVGLNVTVPMSTNESNEETQENERVL